MGRHARGRWSGWFVAWALLHGVACRSQERGPAAVPMPAGSGYAATAPAAAAPDLLAAALDDPGSVFPPNGTCNHEVNWEMRRILAAASRESSPGDVPTPTALVERPCATATNALRERTTLAMRRELERQRAAYILDRCGANGKRELLSRRNVVLISDSSEVPRATSSTNVQVAGVDEPDFVKSDGRHLYAAANGKVQIFETWPPERAHLAAKLFDLGNPKKLLLDGERLVVLSSVPRPASLLLRRGSSECTYGYDCDFGGDGSATRVTVFDVQDRTAPKPVRTLDISGSLLTARRVGPNVHVVVHDSGPSWEQLGIERRPREPLETPRKAFDAFERLIKENEALLARMAPEQLLPKVSERSPGGQRAPGPEAPCRIHTATEGTDLVSLVSFDTRTPQGFARTLVGAQAGAVYSSPGALYLAVARAHGRRRRVAGSNDRSPNRWRRLPVLPLR